jgi:ubiquinone/menaquinone biosynthesis C-methylase UbiE
MPSMASDLYTRLDEIDEQTLRSIAGVLEVRGRHPRQAAIRAAYLDRLGKLSGQRVLDVGCGTGVVTRDLARLAGPEGAVSGVDPSWVFVDVAETLRVDQGIENVDFAVYDGHTLPFPDGTFDVVTAVTVLCHVPHRSELLTEMARVVRPGGLVMVFDGDYASIQLEHPDRERTRQIADAWRTTMVDDPYLMRRIVPLVEGAGLEIDSIDGHVHVETARVDEDSSYIWQWALLATRQALAAGLIEEGEASRWTDQLRALNGRGSLFGSVTYLSVLARRP